MNIKLFNLKLIICFGQVLADFFYSKLICFYNNQIYLDDDDGHQILWLFSWFLGSYRVKYI